MSEQRMKEFAHHAERLVSPPDFECLERRGRTRRHALQSAVAGAAAAFLVGGYLAAGHQAWRTDDQVGRPKQIAAEPAENLFATADSVIVYRSESELVAVDPDHPSDAVFIGPADQLDPLAWSPASSRLLLGFGQATEDLYVSNADGSRIQLTTGGTSYSGSFAPDGAAIVYDNTVSGDGRFLDGSGLYLVDATGRGPRLLVPAGGRTAVGDPAWSPDGSHIAFIEASVVAETSWGEPVYRRTLSLVNADGTGRRALLDLGREDRSPTGWAAGLTWSPDGTRLAFDSGGRVYVVNADGSGLHALTDQGTAGSRPAWSPDGTRLAFVCGPRLCTMAADGTNLRGLGDAPPPTGTRFVWASSFDPPAQFGGAR